jgi:uncharacterized membrane protein
MATTRIEFILTRFFRKLWVRAASFAVLGVAIVPLARLIGPLIPSDLVALTGAGSVQGILNILASSMLAVTTFSLSTMVSAYSSAAAAVTPRAVTLLMQDRTSQTVLSTFIGAFLFGLVGIIGIEAQAFSQSGLLVLFLTTIVVIALVVVALIRWISHLTSFGRLADSSRRVEEATAHALRTRARFPALGGVPAPAGHDGRAPAGHRALYAPATGYLQHIDMPRLDGCAKALVPGQAGKGEFDGAGPVLHVACLPGSFVHPAEPLVWVPASLPEADEAAILQAFSVGDERSFDQDPRFGLCVLCEIAERALSPAVNDPGTAIDILGRSVRILAHWLDRKPVAVEYPRVSVPALRIDDLFDDIFPAIARDGAGVLSVQLRLQKTLLALARLSPADFGPVALHQSERALRVAGPAHLPPEETARLEAVAKEIRSLAQDSGRGPRVL